MTVAAPTEPPSLPAHIAERLGELQFRVQTGRLRHWQRDVRDTLQRAGLGEGFTDAEWAETPWYGPLEQWLAPDSRVSDILINGPGRDIIIVEGGQRMNTSVILHEEWVRWTQHQLLLRGGFVTHQAPDDWRTCEGGTTHALIGSADRRLRFAVTRPPATPDGPTIAVRLLPPRWRTLDDMVHTEEGVLPRAAAEMLIDALRHGVTVLVAGETGSGKTTLTAALLQAIGEEKRVVIIEDARELPPVADSIAIEVLRSGMTFPQCVRLTLRQRPDLIVLGEVRGAEALAMLQAAATGHPGIGTIHAPDCDSALRNLERMACEEGSVPPQIVRGMIASATVPIIVCHIGRYGGRRRVGQIVEVQATSGGQSGDKYPINILWNFDTRSGRVERVGNVNRPWGRGRY
jgi:pilus assembly protein CpaF